jgi:hypothetical protein
MEMHKQYLHRFILTYKKGCLSFFHIAISLERKLKKFTYAVLRRVNMLGKVYYIGLVLQNFRMNLRLQIL